MRERIHQPRVRRRVHLLRIMYYALAIVPERQIWARLETVGNPNRDSKFSASPERKMWARLEIVKNPNRDSKFSARKSRDSCRRAVYAVCT